MKKLFSFLLCVLVVSSAIAQGVWTVRTVPNTRLEGNSIHVSDPDGYLTDSAEWAINSALAAIRDKADVFLVTLSSIGDEDPKHFATDLFNYWGIGDAETDNGVLLLFVEDQHALEFETGYGAEVTLTDADCSRIFNRTIVPYFRAGDYESGLCAGIADIVEVYGGEVPMGIMSNVRQTAVDDEMEDKEDTMSGFGAAFFLLFLLPIPVISFFRWLIEAIDNRKRKQETKEESFETANYEGITYITGFNAAWSGKAWERKGFLRFLVYGVALVLFYVVAVGYVPRFMPDAALATQDKWATGIALVGYLTWICLVQNIRELRLAKANAKVSKSPKKIYEKAKNDPHSLLTRIIAPWLGILFSLLYKRHIKDSVLYYCPTCSSPLEKDELFHLPEKRAFEEQIGAYRFSPCRCAAGHRFIERKDGAYGKNYLYCTYCGTKAAQKTAEKVLQAADYTTSGLKELTYTCQHCNKSFVKTQTIPKLVHSSSSGSSSHSHSHSSHSSGGSFGGGRSGGGGYSGRW